MSCSACASTAGCAFDEAAALGVAADDAAFVAVALVAEALALAAAVDDAVSDGACMAVLDEEAEAEDDDALGEEHAPNPMAQTIESVTVARTTSLFMNSPMVKRVETSIVVW